MGIVQITNSQTISFIRRRINEELPKFLKQQSEAAKPVLPLTSSRIREDQKRPASRSTNHKNTEIKELEEVYLPYEKIWDGKSVYVASDRTNWEKKECNFDSQHERWSGRIPVNGPYSLFKFIVEISEHEKKWITSSLYPVEHDGKHTNNKIIWK